MRKDNLLREETLIKEAGKLIKANKMTQKYHNSSFNIFTALNIERDEVFTHSNMIYALLNPRENHGMDDIYLKLFLKEIGISKTFLNYSWAVEREWVFENGRIDFFLKCEKMCVAIEMKIDAGDQDKQLFRYEEYSKGVNSNYLIYYLTLDGKYPSEQSAEGMDKRYLRCVSFKEHILNWLKACLGATNQDMTPHSLIKQYLYLIEKLVGEEKMAEAMKSIIKNADDLMAAITIANGLNEIKTEVLVNFMDELNKQFIKKKVEPVEYNREEAEAYYQGSYEPGLVFKIKEYTLAGGKKANFSVCIAVEYNLYYYFAFMENHEYGFYHCMNREEFQKKHSKVFNECNNAIVNILGAIKRRGPGSLLWEYVLDNNGHNYDFKHFSDNCVELKDNYVEEATRIADIIINLKKTVENQLL
ncbi:PD-(D/E)XK nuclease family protein [Candidatus Clostridium helianthi]|uniref:PD-(D/E)XK nuclease family protein n=1 Tax=Candidatus Clostridium helianthi TaxID=3381660 RepID=A0ABW8S652_9CLOT